MAWYGKYEEESEIDKLKNRIKKLEDQKKQQEKDENFSLTSSYISDDSDE